MMFFFAAALALGMAALEWRAARGRVFGRPCIRLGLRRLEFGRGAKGGRR